MVFYNFEIQYTFRLGCNVQWLSKSMPQSLFKLWVLFLDHDMGPRLLSGFGVHTCPDNYKAHQAF
jgi:hypothetical protein